MCQLMKMRRVTTRRPLSNSRKAYATMGFIETDKPSGLHVPRAAATGLPISM